ncbi:MAG: hypothetical protein DRN20_04905, partial [Thermoplasmata archaeon]
MGKMKSVKLFNAFAIFALIVFSSLLPMMSSSVHAQGGDYAAMVYTTDSSGAPEDKFIYDWWGTDVYYYIHAYNKTTGEPLAYASLYVKIEDSSGSVVYNEWVLTDEDGNYKSWEDSEYFTAYYEDEYTLYVYNVSTLLGSATFIVYSQVLTYADIKTTESDYSTERVNYTVRDYVYYTVHLYDQYWKPIYYWGWIDTYLEHNQSVVYVQDNYLLSDDYFEDSFKPADYFGDYAGNADEGEYAIIIKDSSSNELGRAYFNVYKPVYTAEVNTDKEYYCSGDSVIINISVRDQYNYPGRYLDIDLKVEYLGSPVKSKTYAMYTDYYGNDSIEITIGEHGYNALGFSNVGKYKCTAIYNGDELGYAYFMVIGIYTDKENYAPGEDVKISVYLLDANKDVNLSIKYDNNTVHIASGKTNPKGYFNATYTLPNIDVLEKFFAIIANTSVGNFTKSITMLTRTFVDTDHFTYSPGGYVDIIVHVTGPDITWPIDGADITLSIVGLNRSWGFENETIIVKNATTTNGVYRTHHRLPMIDVDSKYYQINVTRFGQVVDYAIIKVETYGELNIYPDLVAPGGTVRITGRVVGPNGEPVSGADLSIVVKRPVGSVYGRHIISVYYHSSDVWESMTYDVVSDRYEWVYFSDGSHDSGGSHGNIEVYNHHYSQEISVYIDGKEIGTDYVYSWSWSYFPFDIRDLITYEEIGRLNNATTDSMGSVVYELSLPDDAIEGEYRVELIRFNSTVQQDTFDVKALNLTLWIDRNNYVPGDYINIYYSLLWVGNGSAVDGASVGWSIIANSDFKDKIGSGEEVTAASVVHHISVRIPMNALPGDYTVYLNASKGKYWANNSVEINIGAYLDLAIDRQYFEPGDLVSIEITSIPNANISLRVLRRGAGDEDYSEIASTVVSTDALGHATYTYEISSDTPYGTMFAVEGKLEIDNMAPIIRYVYFEVRRSNMISVSVHLDKDAYLAGDDMCVLCYAIYSNGSNVASAHYHYRIWVSRSVPSYWGNYWRSSAFLLFDNSSLSNEYTVTLPDEIYDYCYVVVEINASDWHGYTGYALAYAPLGCAQIYTWFDKGSYYVGDTVRLYYKIISNTMKDPDVYYDVEFYFYGNSWGRQITARVSGECKGMNGTIVFALSPEIIGNAEYFDVTIRAVENGMAAMEDTGGDINRGRVQIVLRLDKDVYTPGDTVSVQYRIISADSWPEWVNDFEFALQYRVYGIKGTSMVIIDDGYLLTDSVNGTFTFVVPKNAEYGEYFIDVTLAPVGEHRYSGGGTGGQMFAVKSPAAAALGTPIGGLSTFGVIDLISMLIALIALILTLLIRRRARAAGGGERIARVG